jgi:hypothetical protein
LKDADSEDQNHFAGAPLVLTEIGGVNFKTAIFSKLFCINSEIFPEIQYNFFSGKFPVTVEI